MRGYKGMENDMTCRGMQYEVGKTYRVEGPVELCKRGLHFCKNLKDVFDFYGRDKGNRFFEVEACGNDVISDGKKCVTSELTVIRELTEVELNRSTYGNGYGDGNGYGNGYGYGNDYGYGNGNGYGYGDGNDYGNIQKILAFND